MPSFAERESSILSSILQKKKPPSELAAKQDEKAEKSNESKVQNGSEFPKASMNENQSQPTAQLQPSLPSNQSIDLLGLNFSSPVAENRSAPEAATSPQKSNQDALLDIFGGPAPSSEPTASIQQPQQQPTNQIDPFFGSSSFEPTNGFGNSYESPSEPSFTPITENIENQNQFLFKNNDTIFENESLKIMIKSEYKQNLGRVTIIFTNKTNFVYQNFMVQSGQVDTEPGIRVILNPIDNSVIQSMGELVQVVNLECLNDFSNCPEILCQFR